MRTRILLLLVVIGLGFVGALLWQFSRSARGLNPQRPATESAAVTPQPDSPSAAPAAAIEQPSSAPREVEATGSDPAFERWIREEAVSVDRPSVDSASKKAQLEKVIAALNPTQTRQLLQTIQSATSTAGEKILSTYLLVESGSVGRGELMEVITPPAKDFGPVTAHSEAELRTIQERTIKLMAVDGLISRAQKDAGAREELIRSIPTIQDSYVRDYVRKRLDEIGVN